MSQGEDISRRKDDHLSISLDGKAGFRRRTNLIECVEPLHQSLPELAVGAIDTSLDLFGRTLHAPFVIAGMTGGTARATDINRDLATCAGRCGFGFGYGSMRPLLKEPPREPESYQMREQAPSALMLANLGVIQAGELESGRIDDLVEQTKTDAICIHLNPAQELLQQEGDRDFRGALDTLSRLANELKTPIIVKETGSGISRRTAAQLADCGIQWVDVGGAGGTSWVGIETQRAGSQELRRRGELLWDWGVPTAASIVYAREAGLRVIATGGMRTALDAARALILGASAVGMAAPFLEAQNDDGLPACEKLAAQLAGDLRAIMLLTGCGRLADFRDCEYVITGELREWIDR